MVYGKQINTIAVSPVEKDMKMTKTSKAKAKDASKSENEAEHFKFENLIYDQTINDNRAARSGQVTPSSARNSLWDKGELYTISKIINPIKNTKVTHYMPVLWGDTNCRLGKVRFNSLMVIIYY